MSVFIKFRNYFNFFLLIFVVFIFFFVLDCNFFNSVFYFMRSMCYLIGKNMRRLLVVSIIENDRYIKII